MSTFKHALEALYGSVDNIDLWVGGLAENHVPGSSVGPTVRAIVSDQFERLRDGDRYWYQRTFSGTSFPSSIIRRCSDVIRRNTTISNLQSNVFFMQASVSGQVFLDSNGNGWLDRRELPMPGVTVQLMDDAGEIVATTTTGRDGRYRFTQFRETGDYQVVVVIPPRLAATTSAAQDVLISRGGLNISGVDFGLRLSLQNTGLASADAVSDTAGTDSATDAALAEMSMLHSPFARMRR